MKKVPVLITIIIIIALAGGFFLYQKFFHKKIFEAWDFVPAETILVYESSTCTACVEEVRNSSIVKIINRAAFNDEDLDSLKILRELILTSHDPKLISLHVTKKDDFDFTFYIPSTTEVNQKLALVLGQLKKNKGITFSEREYNDVQIHEVSIRNKTFSWILIENIFVASFTPVLIEDVIRTYRQPDRSFKHALGEVYTLPRIKNDGGNIYLHIKNFTQWFSLFTSTQPSDIVKEFGQSSLLDVKISEEHQFVLNGFSVDSTNKSNFILSTFNHQSPVPFALKEYISNRAIMFASYGISNGASFMRDLQRLGKRSAEQDTLNQLSDNLGLDLSSLHNNFSGEVGICWTESKREGLSKILIVNPQKGVEQWKEIFNTLSDKVSMDTVFFERFSSYEIREVPIHRFPEKLFAPLVTGFDQCYYTTVGNTLIIGDHLVDLKKYLEDIDREDTWGKSVAQNKFLETTLLESNVSLYLNTPKIWNILTQALQPKWKDFVQKNQPLLNSLGMGAIQFSHLNESYYTNVSFSYKNTGNGSAPVAARERFVTNFSEGIVKHKVVVSHVDKSEEILVQDSSMTLTLLSGQGKVLWKLPLRGYITTDIFQIDFFANGKLQYLFATAGQLHIVDRLGNYVKPYPVSISENDVDFLSVIDYDHSRKYRFLVAGKSGKLWMFDKGGQNLEGWTPRIIDEGLSTAAQHHRILGKDYIIAIRRDGVVCLMNRRGELLRNFPLDLNARPEGDYFLDIGKNRATTSFVLISREGLRIRFNLDGKVLSRETLVKNTVNARFSLVPEANEKSYIIIRKEAKQLTVFKEDLTELLRSDFIGDNPVKIKYENFGSGKVYITLTDLSQDLSFVYDGKGNLLTPLPLESQDLTLRLGNDEKPQLYYNFSNYLTIRPLD